MWRHYPWLTAFLIAPLLYGCVTGGGQAPVALLLGLSVCLLAPELGSLGESPIGKKGRWLLLFFLLLPLIPLPVSVMASLNPARCELASEFQYGQTPAAWLPLTISYAGSLQRIWELLLALSFFLLARHAVRQSQCVMQFATIAAAALVLETSTEWWFHFDGKGKILGLWNDQWHYAGGTFANRNHFADWMYMLLLFGFGFFLRHAWPLHSARTKLYGRRARSWGKSLVLAVILCAALVAAVGSGSRGGIVAVGAGGAVWLALLAVRSHSRKRWLGIAFGLVLAFVLAVLASNFLLQRLTTSTSGFAYKLDIWRDSLVLACRYPLFGTGWGTFATVFSHYKTFGGGKTFWHAENDLVQCVVENGWLGALAVALCAGLFAWKLGVFAWKKRTSEPEMLYGALAGLTVFFVHSGFEFVGQIPANAMLAAALLGFATGLWEAPRLPELPPPPPRRRVIVNYFFGAILIIGACLQGGSLYQFELGQRELNLRQRAELLDKSLRTWPAEPRQVLFWMETRVRVLDELPFDQQPAAAQAFRRQLDRVLWWNPYQWELRLEKAWFELGFAADNRASLAEAWKVVRLNPLESQIPLRFARHFARRHPQTALEFLRTIDLHDPAKHEAVLELAWQAEPHTATLWDFTPDDPEALLRLGDFAGRRGLTGLALEAYRQTADVVPPAQLARRLLALQQPEAALQALANEPASLEVSFLKAKALWQTRRYLDTFRMAEGVWSASARRRDILMPFVLYGGRTDSVAEGERTIETLKQTYRADPSDLSTAKMLGEKIFLLPSSTRDVEMLKELAQKFPAELRFQYMVLETQFEQGNTQIAAEGALRLAERSLAPE